MNILDKAHHIVTVLDIFPYEGLVTYLHGANDVTHSMSNGRVDSVFGNIATDPEVVIFTLENRKSEAG